VEQLPHQPLPRHSGKTTESQAKRRQIYTTRWDATRLPFDTGDRADVDDAATSLQQMRQCGSAQVERSIQVDRKILRPVIVGHRFRPTHLVSSSDIDQDIQTAEFTDALLDRVAAGLRGCNLH
jgi:hypothetical protein